MPAIRTVTFAESVPDIEPPLPTLISHAPWGVARLAQSLAVRAELWRPLLHVDPDRRWYTRLAETEEWEAWLLTWAPGQRTGLHDHGESAGAFVVLSGELVERVPATGRRGGLAGHTLETHDVRAFASGYVHDLAGAGDGPAASLHVYAPKLLRMNRYELDTRVRLKIVATERAGESW